MVGETGVSGVVLGHSTLVAHTHPILEVTLSKIPRVLEPFPPPPPAFLCLRTFVRDWLTRSPTNASADCIDILPPCP